MSAKQTDQTGTVVNEFLGSAQIFTSAVSDLLEDQLDALSEQKVTFSQIKLLKMVSLTEGYTVSNVAQFLGVSTAAASRAVDRLVRRHLLKRTESPSDRRVVHLSLTPEGTTLLARYEASADRALQQVFGSLPPEQLREASEFLDRLSVSIVEGQNGERDMCFRCGIHFRDRCLLRKSHPEQCFFHARRRVGKGTERAG